MHRDFVSPVKTVNRLYLGALKRLREEMRTKCPELWQSGDWILHHGNTPAHKALSVNLLASYGQSVGPQPLYSSYLALCDFSILGAF